MSRMHVCMLHVPVCRPCVGAGYCLDRIYVGHDALCLHNPATGREYLGMPHVITPAAVAEQESDALAPPASGSSSQHPKNQGQRQDKNCKRTRKRVCIIGGGPAGMEAARVCASRGHSGTKVQDVHDDTCSMRTLHSIYIMRRVDVLSAVRYWQWCCSKHCRSWEDK